jgi:two-component system response regulator AtoC
VLELDECWFQKRDFAQGPASSGEQSELKSLNSMEKEHILRVLDHTEGNYGEACKILGITRPTLRKKINDYGLREFIEDSLKA